MFVMNYNTVTDYNIVTSYKYSDELQYMTSYNIFSYCACDELEFDPVQTLYII